MLLMEVYERKATETDIGTIENNAILTVRLILQD